MERERRLCQSLGLLDCARRQPFFDLCFLLAFELHCLKIAGVNFFVGTALRRRRLYRLRCRNVWKFASVASANGMHVQ